MSVAPILVYDRIDANRRNTLLLLPVFAALLIPLAYGLIKLFVLFFFSYNTMMTRADAFHVVGSTEAVTPRMVLLALVSASCVALAGYLASTYIFLWLADGHRVDRRQEPVLSRTVENLCLGTGLAQPAVYVVESSEPNAFSTGRDPGHASLVVTRGLLRLLNERELRGVVAHELSHIGNRDTDLSSMLAMLVGTITLPSAWVKAVMNVASVPGPIGAFFIAGALFCVLLVFDLSTLWWVLYAFFIAPAAATFVRKTISHQREFLADADAVLLTRDPEGLALALAKAGEATGSSANAGVATAHLYFVDPLPPTDSWWGGTFASHPPVAERIALLARMGDGIAGRRLSDAAAKGFEYAGEQLLTEMRQSPEWSRSTGPASGACVSGSRFRLTDRRTLLHKSADLSSPVLADLHASLPITVIDLQPQAIHVRLGDGTVGYIRLFAGLEPLEDEQAADSGRSPRLPRTPFRLTDELTLLYAKPDGSSDVLLQLPSGTIVTFNERVGSFTCVETDGAVGYISTSTRVARTDAA